MHAKVVQRIKASPRLVRITDLSILFFINSARLAFADQKSVHVPIEAQGKRSRGIEGTGNFNRGVNGSGKMRKDWMPLFLLQRVAVAILSGTPSYEDHIMAGAGGNALRRSVLYSRALATS
jgi:hypothetical protein